LRAAHRADDVVIAVEDARLADRHANFDSLDLGEQRLVDTVVVFVCGELEVEVTVLGNESHLALTKRGHCQHRDANVGGVISIGNRDRHGVRLVLTDDDVEGLFLLHRHSNVRIRAAIGVHDSIEVLWRRRAGVAGVGGLVVVACVANAVAVRIQLVGVGNGRTVILRRTDPVLIRVADGVRLDDVFGLVVRRVRIDVVGDCLADYVGDDLEVVTAGERAVDAVLRDDRDGADVRNRNERQLAADDDRWVRVERVDPLRVT
jgi:hypothetical protein